MWVFPCVFLIFVWVSYRWRNRRHIAMLKQIKCGIKAYPFIGHAYKFLKGDGVSRMNVIEEFGNEAIKQGGLTHVLLGNVHFTVLVDPDNIQVVMKTCLEKDDVMRFTRDLIGNGTVVAPVAIWRPRRKVLAPIFSPKNLYNFGHIFSKQSQHFVENLQEVAGRGPTSLTKYISSYAMDSICETALGVITQTEEKNKFLECFEECSRLVAKRMFQPWLYPEAIYKPLISQKKEEMQKSSEETKTTNVLRTFLELMIEASGGERGYSDQELQEEILMIIIGGTDTSGIAVAFATCMMARHPDVQEKVYQELVSVLGDIKRPIVPEDLPHLKYLEAVVRETMRLYPSAPIVVRKVEKDTQLPSGITLVDGSRLIINIWSTHRNPKYWGEDAELFKPERFLGTPLKHPAQFLAFSHGPRVCIGYQYAMMSVKTVVGTLLSRFKVLPKDGRRDVKDNTPLEVSFDVMLKDVGQFTVQLETRI